jgi:hypothetical protein
MPRDGSLTFGNLRGRLAILEIVCAKCERLGRYSLSRLIEEHGQDERIPDWIADRKSNCPLKQSMADPCAARRPDLVRIA